MDTSIVYYNTGEGFTTALVVPTSRKLHLVMIIGKRGLCHRSVGLDEEQFMRPAGVTLKKGLRSFGGIARRKGSTKAARTWLAKAREGTT